MKISERLDKIDSKLQGLDKKVFVLGVMAVLLLYQKIGVLEGILVGFVTLEVTHNMVLNPLLIFALVAGLGSLFRGYLGFLKVKADGAKWDWQMSLISVGPVVIAALGSAQLMDLQPSVTNMILIFFGAAGMNSLQDKFGLQKRPKV